MLISIVIAVFFALAFNIFLSTLEFSFPSLLMAVILFPLRVSIYSSLFALVLSSGYAGFEIPKYFEKEGYDLMKVSKAHSLSFSIIFWLGYAIIFYPSGHFWAHSIAGVFIVLVAFPLCIMLFPYSISYLTVYIVSKVYPEKS